MPSTSEHFAALFSRLQKARNLIDGIRVSTTAMESLMLNEGFAGKVQRIPIGIDIDRFPLRDPESRASARERLGIPSDASVIGSFQKDSDGWGDGTVPKLVKGPDILAESLITLSKSVPDLFVLLAGPARGYLVGRLSDAKIRHLSLGVVPSSRIPFLYQALDLYIVSSREEGGPKAFLESFATGVPLVSTPVGQVIDFATQDSAWISSGFGPEEIADLSGKALLSGESDAKVMRARAVAEGLSLKNLDPNWRDFFSRFLSISP